MTEVTIKTDGACINNGIGERDSIPGCAFIVISKETGRVFAKKAFRPESDIPFTENRCEAYAILGAVNWLIEHKEFVATFESDSKTIVDGIVGLARRRANRDIWESGKGMPRASMLPMIAYLYHCTFDDLYNKNATKSYIAQKESRVKNTPQERGRCLSE